MARKLLVSMLALAMLFGCATLCSAAEKPKPIVTFSFAGYDQLLSNIEAVGRLGGNPNLGKGLEMLMQMRTGGKGLAGLDTKRPWSAFVFAERDKPVTSYWFVPVTDLKELVETVKAVNPALNEQITLHDGVYEIKSGPQTSYVRQKGKWAVLTDQSDRLAGAPDDPLPLLGDLPQKYDVACRVSIETIPKEYREQALAQIQTLVEVFTARLPDESDAHYDRRVLALKQISQQAPTLVNETSSLLVGLGLASPGGATRLDVELTARDGSKLAEKFAAIKPGKTQFAGFSLPDAAVTANWVGTMTEADADRTKAIYATFRKAIDEDLESQKLPAANLKQAKHLVAELFDVLEKNIAARHNDGGLSVLLGPETFTVAVGGAVADTAKLDKLIDEIVAQVKKSNPKAAESIRLNVETYQGVRFHTFSTPVPSPEMQPVLGKRLDVVLGVGEGRLYAAAGRKPLETLKRIIDQSAAAAGKEIPPMKATIAVAPVARFLAQLSDDEERKMRFDIIAGILEQADDKGHVIATLEPVSRGVRLRVQLEEGLLKIIVSMAPPMGAPPQGAAPGHGARPLPK